MKGFGTPQAEKQPVNLLFFFFIIELDNEAIRAGSCQGLSAVVSFVKDEKMRLWIFVSEPVRFDV
jgi:hypothetical protein